jgi:1-phosphofructokinase
MLPEPHPRIATVTLSPALDLTVRLPALAAGEVNRAGPAELRPAGKGVNVSVMLAVLGEPSLAAGLLGEGDLAAFGAFLRPFGVTPDFVSIPGRCRINVKLVETEAGRVTDVNPAGPAASPAALEALGDRLGQHAPRIAVLAGSLPPGVPDTAWAELAGLLGRALPDRAALVQGALALRDRGVGRVVVSDGGEGALFVLPGATLWATPPKVALTTTVGAGDAMVAGLAAAMARGLDAEATARLATGCAAAAVSRDVGAAGGGVPVLAEIERLAAATRIEAL